MAYIRKLLNIWNYESEYWIEGRMKSYIFFLKGKPEEIIWINTKDETVTKKSCQLKNFLGNGFYFWFKA